MDNSRDADLQALHHRFNDPNLSQTQRNSAYRKFQDIQTQIKDKKLVSLRQRLIGAHRANDDKEIEKIERLIKEHRYRQTGVTPRIA